MLRLNHALLLLALAAPVRPASTQAPSREAAAIDSLVRVYARGNNFSGEVLAARGDRVVFARAYGDADREHAIANTLATPMHVASVSMQFTAAAIMRLIDMGRLSLDTRVGRLVPSLRGGDRITIRDLLEERSGLSDINGRTDYPRILEHHQTPASLVAVIAGDSLLFPPGSPSRHEEHSAYNVLALVVEQLTGRPFAAAVHQLVFAPLGMTGSGIDDDAVPPSRRLARGYQPVGVSGIEPAAPIHWSGKTGNGSAYVTAPDELRFIRALFDGHFPGRTSRAMIVDSAGPNVGYGWFRRPNRRFGEFEYEMTGRAPGFASYVVRLPRSRVTVVVFSNFYASVTSEIGADIAAILLGKPYQPFVAGDPLSVAARDSLAGLAFRFGADFYQPGVLTILSRPDGSYLQWPNGGLSPLIPVAHDRFIDRAYWEPVVIERDAAGAPTAMTYDRYRGTRAP